MKTESVKTNKINKKHNNTTKKTQKNVCNENEKMMSDINSKNNGGVIPFKRGFDMTEMVDVKFTRSQVDANGMTQKRQVVVKKFPLGGSNEQFLLTASNFRKAITTMQWTTGPDLYTNFESCFEDERDWETFRANNAFANSVPGFTACLQGFIAEKFESNAWELHSKMLRHAKKPFKMSPKIFLSLIQCHNGILTDLPGQPQGAGAPPINLLEYDMKIILHDAMPELHRNNFGNAGFHVHDQTLSNVVSYFEDQHNRDPKVLAQKTGASSSTDRRDNRSGNRSDNAGRGYGGYQRSYPMGNRHYDGPGRSAMRSRHNQGPNWIGGRGRGATFQRCSYGNGGFGHGGGYQQRGPGHQSYNQGGSNPHPDAARSGNAGGNQGGHQQGGNRCNTRHGNNRGGHQGNNQGGRHDGHYQEHTEDTTE